MITVTVYRLDLLFFPFPHHFISRSSSSPLRHFPSRFPGLLEINISDLFRCRNPQSHDSVPLWSSSHYIPVGRGRLHSESKQLVIHSPCLTTEQTIMLSWWTPKINKPVPLPFFCLYSAPKPIHFMPSPSVIPFAARILQKSHSGKNFSIPVNYLW